VAKNPSFEFVVCVNDPEVLRRRLLASPCLHGDTYGRNFFFNAASAAAAFNGAMDSGPGAQWLIWVHQDVYLPKDWDARFMAEIRKAERSYRHLGVVGVYGVAGSGSRARHAGHVLDRGLELNGTCALPCRVDSLDELLFAVRRDTGLHLEPDLGFDFYGTDLALTARERGLDVVVVDACCEHWSSLSREGPFPRHVVERVRAAGEAFERKWSHRLPVVTPCFSINRPGDVAAQCGMAQILDP